MLCQLRRAVLAAFLVLIAFAGTAAAECAWVLWQTTGGTFRGVIVLPTWQLHAAHETKAKCDEARGLMFAYWAGITPAEGVQKNVANDAVYFTTTDGQSERRFICLPDTVDPRGPKGDRR